MALLSPGVEVTVIDESQYIPSAVNTVPYFLIATAQNKADAAGIGVAAGTTAANANKTRLITSQRDLAATYGVPFFYNTTTGTPINGYELNEYGLLAAYSALGITNRAYVQRVDIDLTELTASLSRPTGDADNGTYWLDTSTTLWGVFEWNQTTATFTNQVPIVLTDTADVVDYDNDDYTPLETIGSIGDYAVSAVALSTPMYYKNLENNWELVGSDDWKLSWPTIQGSVSNPTLTVGSNMYINGNLVTVPAGGTVSAFVTQINNALPYATYGFFTSAVDGKLTFYADSTATNDGSSASGGVLSIQAGPTGGTALLTALGISAIEYFAPEYFPGYSYQAPRWRTSDTVPHPTGSVWQNLSAANNGLSLKIKKYNSALDQWVPQTTNAYSDDVIAINAIDPTGGGKNIPVGTTYAQYNASAVTVDPSSSFLILERVRLGATIVTGDILNPTFTNGDAFTIAASQAGEETIISGTVTLTGTTPAAFISAVSAANIPFVSASLNSAGALVFTHSQGGVIAVADIGGDTAIADAGFTDATLYVRPDSLTAGALVLSNWVTSPEFTYTVSSTTPDQNPADGRLWYYSSVSDVDIMIQENGAWLGYQNVTNDTRGFDLSLTNASGPIIAASAPTTQNNVAESPLQLGDLWIDTSDLENYPLLYRWEQVNGLEQWVQVDTTDQISSNGILFADARWGDSGAIDPVADAIPTIESLLTSNHLDLDAPDPALYPQGMLLFNTRRSGYNVKAFTTNYFTSGNYPDAGAYNPAAPTNNANLPKYSYTWVTASGNKTNGSMYSGRQAQRALIIQAMKSGIDTNLQAREEQNQFNLIAAPGYPELLTNLVALSNERANTLFCIGDTPMRLNDNGTDLATYATNNGGLGLPTEDGLTVGSAYAAVFYPSCQTNDLSGNTVVAPSSHMMVRTILRSDAVSYPWLAPAGTRRGVVDNASAIGYINAATGEFVQIAVSQGLRDVLYQNNINPITFIPGIGITNFGNKTRQGATTALDRINVARLVAFLRGRLEEIGKLYLFEPNDQITRNEITNTVNSLMIDLIAKRAIYDYLVVCDLSNNTPSRIDANELWVDVAIEPVKAVEFIYIPLRIKNTGEISGGSAAA
jgi:phage tail sheath protein FI